MKLGKYFSLSELTITSTGFQNIPGTQELINLARLVVMLLDPVREICGRVDISSGFRSKKVNEDVGGSDKSFHLKGCSADISSPDWDIDRIAEEIVDAGLPFDKIIIEYGFDGKEWLHVQIASPGDVNRHEVWIARWNGSKMIYTTTGK